MTQPNLASEQDAAGFADAIEDARWSPDKAFDASEIFRATLPSMNSDPFRPDGKPRVKGLFLVRESDKFDRSVFSGMAAQTYAAFRAIARVAEVEAVAKLGLSPLDQRFIQVTYRDGRRKVTKSVEVFRRREGTTKAYIFQVGEYVHVWSQASAAEANELGANEFTQLLMSAIREFRPLNLYAANVTRLIRSQTYGNELISVLPGNVDTLWVQNITLPLTGPTGGISILMLQIMGWCAALERDAIVQRTQTGRVFRWACGDWAPGATAIPFGYKYVKRKRRLVPDPTMRDIVEEMLVILAAEAPPSEKARALDELGVVSSRTDRKTGKPIEFSAMAHPDQAIRGLMSWAPLWCHGEFLFRIRSSFPHMKELAGVQIMRHPDVDRDPGEIQLLHKVDVPEGGWARPEILELFAAKAIAESEMRVQNGATRNRPLSERNARDSEDPILLDRVLNRGNMDQRDVVTLRKRNAARALSFLRAQLGRSWINDGWLYELGSDNSGFYSIHRWPLRARERASRVHKNTHS